jgi:hypothetical protein
MIFIQDVFKQFCKERHAEDKGKHFDLLQEVYASTELFDISMVDHTKDEKRHILMEMERTTDGIKGTVKTTEGINLPFQRNFIKCSDNVYLFVKEYAPNIITGTIYTYDKSINCPFLMDIYPDCIEISSNYGNFNLQKVSRELLQVADKIATDLFEVALLVLMDLNKISKKAVATDKVYCTEYYRRKNAPTIKVSNRPIYYILGDKSDKTTVIKFKSICARGELSYSNAFKVRGHWRRIAEKSLGKDRSGTYGVQGYTWVTEYVKGEGDLIQRLRVIK